MANLLSLPLTNIIFDNDDKRKETEDLLSFMQRIHKPNK